MRLQIVVGVLLVAVAAEFLLLNPDLAREIREVQLPGARLSAPILGITVLAAVGGVLVMLGAGAVAGLAHGRSQRRLNARLAQREHELAIVKSAAYDRVVGTIDALHRELSARPETEGRRWHEELQARMAALERTIAMRVASQSEGAVARAESSPAGGPTERRR